MKTLLITLISVLLLASGAGCSRHEEGHSDTTQGQSQREIYTCPMHPSVQSDRPGACPVCGMALVKKTVQQETSADELAALTRISLSPTQRVLANISVIPVRRESIRKHISAAGFIEPAEPLRALVAARFRGRVERLHVASVGERVTRGAPLFDLYSPELVAAQQEYVLARSSTVAASPGTFDGSGLRSSIEDRLRLHYGMTASQLEELARSGTPRTSLTFHAPLGGTVLRKEVVEGQYVDEGMVLYEVADLSTVWIYFDVYEQDVSFVTTGARATFTVGAFPGSVFEGAVDFVEPVVQPETRTVRVRMKAPNRDGRLKPGMFASGEISVTLDPSLVVPASAVLSLGRSHVVWVEVSDNTFEPRGVVIGTGTDEQARILSGLKEGEHVAVTGGYLLDSESALRAPSAPAPHADHLTPTNPAGRAALEPFIHVEGGYHPDTVRVREGAVRLKFYRNEKSSCTNELVIPEFGVRVALAAFDTTLIAFDAPRRGSFRFSCGMDMLHGVLVVE